MRLKVNVPELFRLWTSGVPHAEICQQLGIPQGSLWRVRDYYKLPPREKVMSRCDRDSDDPSPEEIAEAAAAIRSKWSPEETERRIVGARPSSYRIPNYRFSRRTMSYAAALDS